MLPTPLFKVWSVSCIFQEDEWMIAALLQFCLSLFSSDGRRSNRDEQLSQWSDGDTRTHESHERSLTLTSSICTRSCCSMITAAFCKWWDLALFIWCSMSFRPECPIEALRPLFYF
jgi:hypothetical protein